jgi:hypothetical protein
MFLRACLLALALGALAACASSSENREWMKVNQKYSGEEFRRDVATCSKAGKLDDTCMRARGWVDVSSQKVDKAPESTKPQYAPPSTPISR